MSKKKAKTKKTSLLELTAEIEAGYPNSVVVGVDEVGRGCLAGPVYAAAAILPGPDCDKPLWLSDVGDSKGLDEEMREELFPKIKAWVQHYEIGIATVAEIDRLNIFHASQLAMIRAIRSLKVHVDHVLVDGKFELKNFEIPQTAIVGGDDRALCIACASIIAKVERDREMVKLHVRYPGYGLDHNRGYPTPDHKRALKALGPTEIHRRSFGPVAEQFQKGFEFPAIR